MRLGEIQTVYKKGEMIVFMKDLPGSVDTFPIFPNELRSRPFPFTNLGI